jgi:hypothetical protein
MGLLLIGAGALTFAMVAPFVAITRPTNIGKPFRSLIAVPVRYTFLDPLGEHPATRPLEQ